MVTEYFWLDLYSPPLNLSPTCSFRQLDGIMSEDMMVTTCGCPSLVVYVVVCFKATLAHGIGGGK